MEGGQLDQIRLGFFRVKVRLRLHVDLFHSRHAEEYFRGTIAGGWHREAQEVAKASSSFNHEIACNESSEVRRPTLRQGAKFSLPQIELRSTVHRK